MSHNILIISPEPWGTNWLSKHHYAIALKQQGHNVFFLNPPGEVNRLSLQDSILIINYKQVLRGINRLPSTLRNIINLSNARRIQRIAQVDSWDMIWTFDPYRFQEPAVFKAQKLLFFAVDDHKTDLDKELAKNVDLVLTTSKDFATKYQHIAKRIEVINHGLASHFEHYPYSDYVPKQHISVVYVGNLLIEVIDWQTLLKIVEDNRKVRFTFIGPYKASNLSADGDSSKVSELKSFDNAELLGEVPSAKLPDYLNQADLLLMCYDADNYRIEVSNPHKLLEYLSSGRVVVSNFTASYEDYAGLLEMTDRQQDLPELLKKVISNLESYNSPDMQQRRRQFALKHSYPIKTQRILELIER